MTLPYRIFKITKSRRVNHIIGGQLEEKDEGRKKWDFHLFASIFEIPNDRYFKDELIKRLTFELNLSKISKKYNGNGFFF